MFSTTQYVFEVIWRKADGYYRGLPANFLGEAMGAVSQKDDEAVEKWASSAFVDAEIRNITYLYVKQANSALVRIALYIELNDWEKSVI